MDSKQLYQEVILDHNKKPRNWGQLEDATHRSEGVNPLCGDRLRVELRLGAGRDVDAIRFQGDACAIATASADLLAEMVEGHSVTEALRVERDALVTALGAPIRASRLPCVSLPLAVLRGALGAGAERVAAARGRGASPGNPAPSDGSGAHR